MKYKTSGLFLLAFILIGYSNCGDFVAYTPLSQSSTNILAPDPDPLPPELPPAPEKIFLYLALQGTNLIETFSVNLTDGKLTKIGSVATNGSVMPLAIHPNKKYLYAGLDARRSIASYLINPMTGLLTLDKEVPIVIRPVYIHVDAPGKNLITASYSDSQATVLPLLDTGSTANQTSDTKATGTNSHAAISVENSSFVFVTNTTANTISQFSFDSVTGLLTPNSLEPFIQAPPGSGPRHVVKHPSLDILYFVNELSDTVTAYNFDKITGRLTEIETLSTIPNNFNNNNNTCADIHITPDGKYLYASNRGHNSLAIFAVNVNGALTPLGHQLVTGTPREFEIDPTGTFIYVAGLGLNKLTSYLISPTTGLLTEIEMLDTNGGPIWVYSLALP